MSFVAAFSLIRQCLYNLQGAGESSSKPTELDGADFSEEEVLTKSDGAAKKMANRDIAMN